MPSHPHTFGGTNVAGNSANPGTTLILAATPSGFPIYDGTATPTALAPRSVSTAGGSLPHENRQPCLAISYIISLYGIYPSQN
jgi:microcystin-dependent protein